MKKHVFLFLSLLPVMASAEVISINGINYTLDAEKQTAEVVNGTYKGKVSIPDTVPSVGTKYAVKSIAKNAFYGCSKLDTLEIPATVNSIGAGAFYSLRNLKNILVKPSPSDVADEDVIYEARGNALIERANKKLILGCQATVIPEDVESIASYAFGGCSQLDTLLIPAGVKYIAPEAFVSCSGLKSIQVAEGNTVYKATDNTLVETATKKLVLGCQTSKIPDDVTEIGKLAFYGCTTLDTLAIPASVKAIGQDAFYGCRNIKSISVEESNTVYAASGNALIEKANNKLILGCQATVIPADVDSIASYAFGGCSGLDTLKIPVSVKYIASDAFAACSGLDTIIVADENTVYEGNGSAIIEKATKTLILGCKNTKIPEDVKAIGKMAFYGCAGLDSICLPASIDSIAVAAFYDCHNLKKVVSLIEDPFKFGRDAFSYISAACTLTVPNGKMLDYEAKGWTSDVFQGMIVEAEASVEEGESSEVAGRYVTGITGIEATAKRSVYYDLQGRFVKNPGKGLYIVNGKKVMIK